MIALSALAQVFSGAAAAPFVAERNRVGDLAWLEKQLGREPLTWAERDVDGTTRASGSEPPSCGGSSSRRPRTPTERATTCLSDASPASAAEASRGIAGAAPKRCSRRGVARIRAPLQHKSWPPPRSAAAKPLATAAARRAGRGRGPTARCSRGALSRSIWHAWGSQMPAALVASGHLEAAAADTGAFTSHLLIAARPENGRNPAPTDGTQIAYGADSRLQSLLAVDRPGRRALAGVAAAWYFGNNPAKTPMYDPATGITYDGVARDGTINRNSGVGSTIHGQLSMLALDAAPDGAAQARKAVPLARTTYRVVEAEAVGTGTIVRPPDAWTGGSAWSGGAYVQGGTLGFDAEGLIQPLALTAADGGRSRWGALGTLDHTGGVPQGASAFPGFIEPQTLPRAAHGRAGSR